MKKYFAVPIYIFKKSEKSDYNPNVIKKTNKQCECLIVKKTKKGFIEIKTGRHIPDRFAFPIEKNDYRKTGYYVYSNIMNTIYEDGVVLFTDTSFKKEQEIYHLDTVKDYLSTDVANNIFNEYDKIKEEHKNKEKLEKIKEKKQKYIQIKENIKDIVDNYKTDKKQNKEIKKLIKDYKSKGE